jgi:hypothetical protein
MLCGHVRGEGLQALFPARGLQGAQTLLQASLVGEVLGRSDVRIGVHRGHGHSFVREALPSRFGRRLPIIRMHSLHDTHLVRHVQPRRRLWGTTTVRRARRHMPQIFTKLSRAVDAIFTAALLDYPVPAYYGAR